MTDKINIYYDYEEDYHYQAKIEDSFLHQEDYGGKSLDEILSVLKTQDETLKTAEYVILGIYHFFTCHVPTKNHEIILHFFDIGGIDVLISLLTRYSDQESPVIPSYGCLIMIIIISAVPEMKEYFGEKGFCEIISYILSVNVGIADVSEYGTYAIACLTKKHFPNIHRFYKMSNESSSSSPVPPALPPASLSSPRGSESTLPKKKSISPPLPLFAGNHRPLCELLSQIGIYGCNVRHSKSVLIARNICFAIGNISEAIFTRSFKEYQLLPLLLQLFTLHYNKDIFINSMFYVIHRILLLNNKFLEDFLNGEIMNILSEVIQHYSQNIPILFRIWQLFLRFYQIGNPITSSSLSSFASSSSSFSSFSSLTSTTSGSLSPASSLLGRLLLEKVKTSSVDYTLFSAILLILSHREFENSSEVQLLAQIVKDLNPENRMIHHQDHYELFQNDILYEKYLQFLLKMKEDSTITSVTSAVDPVLLSSVASTLDSPAVTAIDDLPSTIGVSTLTVNH
jgi:hypothetical protein